MAEQQQFYVLLGNLMSPDNNARKHSEVGEGHAAVLRGDKPRTSVEPGAVVLAKGSSLASPVWPRAQRALTSGSVAHVHREADTAH